jgi:hypothetical protein
VLGLPRLIGLANLPASRVAHSVDECFAAPSPGYSPLVWPGPNDSRGGWPSRPRAGTRHSLAVGLRPGSAPTSCPRPQGGRWCFHPGPASRSQRGSRSRRSCFGLGDSARRAPVVVGRREHFAAHPRVAVGWRPRTHDARTMAGVRGGSVRRPTRERVRCYTALRRPPLTPSETSRGPRQRLPPARAARCLAQGGTARTRPGHQARLDGGATPLAPVKARRASSSPWFAARAIPLTGASRSTETRRVERRQTYLAARPMVETWRR